MKNSGSTQLISIFSMELLVALFYKEIEFLDFIDLVDFHVLIYWFSFQYEDFYASKFHWRDYWTIADRHFAWYQKYKQFFQDEISWWLQFLFLKTPIIFYIFLIRFCNFIIMLLVWQFVPSILSPLGLFIWWYLAFLLIIYQFIFGGHPLNWIVFFHNH